MFPVPMDCLQTAISGISKEDIKIFNEHCGLLLSFSTNRTLSAMAND